MSQEQKPQEQAKELTPRQARFVEEYLRDRNMTQAAIRAGYAVKNAGRTGYALMRSPQYRHVQIAVEEQGQDLARTSRSMQEALRRTWFDMAAGDPKEILPPEGEVFTVEQLRGLPEDVFRRIREFRQTTYIDTDGQPATKLTIKLHDPLAAGKLLGNHLGMFRHQVDISGTLDLDGAAAELSRALDSLRASREEIAGLIAGAVAAEAARVRGGAESEG